MIKIRRGTQILTVPTKAFKEFYQIAGWQRVVATPKVSSWESKLREMSNADLKKLAQERGLKVAGASKKSLIEALIEQGE